MGAKRHYYDKLSHCKDWIIWTDPFTYRLIRLMSGEMPCGIQTSCGSRTYIFNGEHSFTMANSAYGRYNCSEFYSEKKMYEMLTSWCRKECHIRDGLDEKIKWCLQAPDDLYDKLMRFPRDYTQCELRTACLNNDRHHEVGVAKFWGADQQSVEVNGNLLYLSLKGYRENTRTTLENVYLSKTRGSMYQTFRYSAHKITRL